MDRDNYTRVVTDNGYLNLFQIFFRYANQNKY